MKDQLEKKMVRMVIKTNNIDKVIEKMDRLVKMKK